MAAKTRLPTRAHNIGVERSSGALSGLPAPSEHDEQVALFRWAGYVAAEYPQLRWMFAIPNGGQRHIAVAARLKAEGVKAGVLDIFSPCPRPGYAGCWVEMKAAKGRLTPEQREWMAHLQGVGYMTTVAHSWTDAASFILLYLGADDATIARLVDGCGG